MQFAMVGDRNLLLFSLMVETTKNLRVAIDISFKPFLQCREWFSSARTVFSMMHQGFTELTQATYLAMKRPQFDFAVKVVTPYLQEYLKLVETRCLKGFRGWQYPARLRELQFPSMQCHILRAVLITAYDLFHGNLSLPLG